METITHMEQLFVQETTRFEAETSKHHCGDNRHRLAWSQKEFLSSCTAPVAGGVERRMSWMEKINKKNMCAYFWARERGSNLTTYRIRLLS